MEKIYTPNEIACEVTDEILAKIKIESKKMNYRVLHDKYIYYDHRYLVNRAREIAFKSSRYKNESLLFKNLLAANIAFLNDDKIVDVLFSHGLSYEEIMLVNDANVSTVEKLKILYKISFTLRRYYGTDVTNLALNRLNEIIAFNPEILNRETDEISYKVM